MAKMSRADHLHTPFELTFQFLLSGYGPFIFLFS
jgi:hypothetical protein